MPDVENINEDIQYNFIAFIDSAKTLFNVLKSINFQEFATFCATERGLKITVEQGKCFQASAYIPAENFNQYTLLPDSTIEFKVSLNVLTECLNIFGSGDDTSVKMYYKSEGNPLVLILEHMNVDDVITDCEIKTCNPEELVYFPTCEDSDKETTVVVKGSPFLAVLSDLDKAAEVIKMTISPDQGNFTISTLGSQDKSKIEIPKSSEMVHSFICPEIASAQYKFSHIKLMMKGLHLAIKVALKLNQNGLLIVQQMIEKEEKSQMFIEYFITPLVIDDENED